MNPFILVLHFQFELFEMNFSIPIDSLCKHKLGNSKKTKSRTIIELDQLAGPVIRVHMPK